LEKTSSGSSSEKPLNSRSRFFMSPSDRWARRERAAGR
jgi:hypothetical protein